MHSFAASIMREDLLHPMFDQGTLLRLFLATCAGLILGIPYRHQPGGIRIHVLVTLGAAYFSTTAVHLVGAENPEVLRVIQGITSGIGFVGAASVLKTGGTVHGVRTAASIWIAAAVGCDAGLGMRRTVLVTAPLITILTIVVGKVENYFIRRRRRTIKSGANGRSSSGAK